jgi:rubredoxin
VIGTHTLCLIPPAASRRRARLRKDDCVVPDRTADPEGNRTDHTTAAAIYYNGLPQQSIPAGTSFADIPTAWRCPDCGTEKTTFRPYIDSIPEKAALWTRP